MTGGRVFKAVINLGKGPHSKLRFASHGRRLSWSTKDSEKLAKILQDGSGNQELPYIKC